MEDWLLCVDKEALCYGELSLVGVKGIFLLTGAAYTPALSTGNYKTGEHSESKGLFVLGVTKLL
jgi:hypothetical protein